MAEDVRDSRLEPFSVRSLAWEALVVAIDRQDARIAEMERERKWRRASGLDMPPYDERVWVAYRVNDDWHVDVGWHEGAEWWLKSGKWQDIEGTLWMPIPPMPWGRQSESESAGRGGEGAAAK